MRPPSIFYQRFSRLLAALMMIVASAAAIAQEQPQSADPAFTQVVKTDNPDASGPTQMTLPLESGAVYDVTINWGDTTIPVAETITTSNSLVPNTRLKRIP